MLFLELICYYFTQALCLETLELGKLTQTQYIDDIFNNQDINSISNWIKTDVFLTKSSLRTQLCTGL